MKERYKFKTVIKGVSHQKLGERLVYLHDSNNNQLTSEIVKKDAWKHKSHYGNHFDRDRDVAAENWWDQQAQQLIQNVVIDIKIPDKSGELITHEVRLFHNIRDEGSPYKGKNNSRYIMINHVYEDPKSKEYVLKMAYNDLVSFRNKYSTLDVLSDHIPLLNDLIESLKPKS